MKRILSSMLIIIISISLIGCQGKEVVSQAMEYKINEDYSDKISTSVAITLIDIFKATEKSYDSALDLENMENEKYLMEYMISHFTPMVVSNTEEVKKGGDFKEKDNEVIRLSEEVFKAIYKLTELKTDYQLDEINSEIGVSPKHTQTYYEDTSKEIKEEIKSYLGRCKTYLK